MEQLDSIATDILHQFKSKIKEAICLFNSMPDCMKLEAVHFWKDISVRIKFFSADQPLSDEDLRVVELEPVEEVVSSQVDAHVTDSDTPGLMALTEKLRVVCSDKTSVDCNGGNLLNDVEDVTETMFCYSGIDIVTCERGDDKQMIKLATPVEISQIYAKPGDAKEGDENKKGELKKLEENEESEVMVVGQEEVEEEEEETILDIEELKEITKTDLDQFQEQTENNPVLRKSKRIRIRKDKTDMYFDLEIPEGDGPARLVNPNENNLNENVCNYALNIISNDVKSPIPSRTSCKKKTLSQKSNGPYACEICGLEVPYRAAMKVHRRRHSGEKPFTCSICNRSFTTKGNKLRHEKTHSGEKPYECVECKKCFTEKKSLKVHMRSHTGERPYKCQICGRGFAQTGILKTHLHLHTGHKGHLCDTCGKAFRQKSQLRLHQRRHLNHRTFQCPEPDCEASFFTKGDLQRHKLKHSGARPFICNLCPKTFTRLQYLKEHLNQHKGIKPYTCKLCDLSFYDMSTYYRHTHRHKPESEDATVAPTTMATSSIVEANEVHNKSVVVSARVAPTTASVATVIEASEVIHDESITVGSAMAAVTPATTSIIETGEALHAESNTVMTYFVTSGEVTEEEHKVLEQQAVVAAAAAAETVGQSHQSHLAAIPTGHGDGHTTEVYQITVDPSLINTDEQTGQQVVTTMDFSAINLLANATTQEYLSSTS